jgi:hypothetical protein
MVGRGCDTPNKAGKRNPKHARSLFAASSVSLAGDVKGHGGGGDGGVDPGSSPSSTEASFRTGSQDKGHKLTHSRPNVWCLRRGALLHQETTKTLLTCSNDNSHTAIPNDWKEQLHTKPAIVQSLFVRGLQSIAFCQEHCLQALVMQYYRRGSLARALRTLWYQDLTEVQRLRYAVQVQAMAECYFWLSPLL